MREGAIGLTKAKMHSPHIETMSREEMRDLQGKRLNAQVAYVYRNSSFYRRKFESVGLEPDDIRTIDDISKIPFTTKDELRADQENNPPYGSNVCIPLEDVVWLPTTSGTTGRPVILPRGQADI